jgi:hypothetical protein
VPALVELGPDRRPVLDNIPNHVRNRAPLLGRYLRHNRAQRPEPHRYLLRWLLFRHAPQHCINPSVGQRTHPQEMLIIRQAAADLGVSNKTVSKARSSGVNHSPPATVTGRDGTGSNGADVPTPPNIGSVIFLHHAPGYSWGSVRAPFLASPARAILPLAPPDRDLGMVNAGWPALLITAVNSPTSANATAVTQPRPLIAFERGGR